MTLARLLAAALLLCSFSTFAQDQPSQNNRVPGNFKLLSDVFGNALPQPSEAWRQLPNGRADATTAKNPLERIQVDQFKINPQGRTFNPADQSDVLVTISNVPPDDDTTCYSIRSYVVARDGKGSDATHAAGYSTCQPSNRYGVKTAELRLDSNRR